MSLLLSTRQLTLATVMVWDSHDSSICVKHTNRELLFISHLYDKMKRKYEQSYRAEWEQESEYSQWLCRNRDGKNAHCKACNCKILPRIASLKEHALSTKHKKNIVGYSGTSQVRKYILYIKTSFSLHIRIDTLRNNFFFRYLSFSKNHQLLVMSRKLKSE